MTHGLFTPQEVTAMILAGNNLLLAGDINLLSQLPAGNWIGGSTPYSILAEVRSESYDKIFVNRLPEYVTAVEIKEYNTATIRNIYNDGPHNGFTVLIMPYQSKIAEEYSFNVTGYENFAMRPVCGWIAAIPIGVAFTEKACTVSGKGPCISPVNAVAMHISLPETKYAEIHTFNPYVQGDGDRIQFDRDSITVTDAIINGSKRSFPEYLRETGYNTSEPSIDVPLVGDYTGAMINNVIENTDERQVLMAVPVFKHIDYKFARIGDNIVAPALLDDRIVFSVTCFGNYARPHICSQYLRQMKGPAAFGEIAYQHICQTTVYVTVDDIADNVADNVEHSKK
jgi:hypothetical protein